MPARREKFDGTIRWEKGHHILPLPERRNREGLYGKVAEGLRAREIPFNPEILKRIPHTRLELAAQLRALENPGSIRNRKLSSVTTKYILDLTRLYDRVEADNANQIRQYRIAKARAEVNPSDANRRALARVLAKEFGLSEGARRIVRQTVEAWRNEHDYANEQLRAENIRTMEDFYGLKKITDFFRSYGVFRDVYGGILKDFKGGLERHAQLGRVPIYRGMLERLGDRRAMNEGELIEFYSRMLPQISKEQKARAEDERIEMGFREWLQKSDRKRDEAAAVEERLKADYRNGLEAVRLGRQAAQQAQSSPEEAAIKFLAEQKRGKGDFYRKTKGIAQWAEKKFSPTHLRQIAIKAAMQLGEENVPGPLKPFTGRKPN